MRVTPPCSSREVSSERPINTYTRKATPAEVSDVFYRAHEIEAYHSLSYLECLDIVIEEYAAKGIQVVSDRIFHRNASGNGKGAESRYTGSS